MAGALSVSITLVTTVINARPSVRSGATQSPFGMALDGLVPVDGRHGRWVFGIPQPRYAPELGNHRRHVRLLRRAINPMGSLGY